LIVQTKIKLVVLGLKISRNIVVFKIILIGHGFWTKSLQSKSIQDEQQGEQLAGFFRNIKSKTS